MKCKHYLSGCVWSGELRDLEPHLRNSCPNVFLTCSNQCGCIVQRAELHSHLTEECCYRIISCQYCEMHGTFEFITNRHSGECPLMPVDCLNKCKCPPILPTAQNETSLIASIRQLLNRAGSSNHTAHLSNPGIMEIHLSVQASQSMSEPFLPIIIKLEDFEQKKGNSVVWQSPSFYTDPFGYKLCLVVYANGCCRGVNSYLSVFVHVMAGEFDNRNDWPIDEEITVELQNQLEPRQHHAIDCSLTRGKPPHIRRKVQRSPESNARARKGSGTPLFITHSALYSSTGRCQYLKNNCLYFAVY